MLYSTFFLVLQVLATISCSHAETNLRGGARREQTIPTVFRVMVFDNLSRHESDAGFEHLDSVVTVPIMDGAEGSGFYSIDLPADILALHHEEIEAGTLYVEATGVSMNDDHVSFETISVLDEVAAQQHAEHRPVDRHLAMTGQRTVAVLRVSLSSGANRSPVYSAAQIQQQLFSSEVGLSNQYKLCSNDSLQFVNAGVFDITVPGALSSYPSAAAIRNKALEIFAQQRNLPNAGNFADHVMVIIPPNSYPGFVGNAATGGYVSTLNNDWSLDVMVYMHEIGHNLGLGHAYLSDNSGDFSSHMSATGWEPNLVGPKKCFNAASNAQLGWFASRTANVNLSSQPTQKVDLAAFAEARSGNKQNPIMIQVGSYYIQYNYASGFNSGTEQLRNMVTIAHSEPGKTIVEKNGLAPNGSIFTVNNFQSGKALQVQACGASNGDGYNPARVTVALTLGVNGSPCSVAQAPPATQAPPTTQAPPPKTQAPPPPTTQAPPPPPQNDKCPSTERLTVSFRRGRKNKVRTVRCSWVGQKTQRAKRFCKINNLSAGGKIWDTCVAECSSVTHSCQV